MLNRLKKVGGKFNCIEFKWLVMSLIFTIIIDILHGFVFNLFILNYLIFLSITSIAFLFKKRKTVYFLLSGGIVVTTVASSIIMKFRGTPLTAADLYSIKDGLSIGQKYLGKSFFVIVVLVLILALVATIVSFKREKKQENFSYIRSIFIFTGTILLTSGVYKFDKEVGLMKNYNWDLAATYSSNGFLVSYYNSTKELKTTKPETYTKENIDKIKEKLDTEASEVNGTIEKPNIIMVQLESFIDPYRLKGVTFSEDPMPNIRKLETEGPHGTFGVPTFGGGTVRTEFETLTGYSAANLGAGQIPNNTILKQKAVESMATILKDKGYDATAIHNYEGNFYDRDTVYSSYGFDKFVSMEYIEDLTYNGKGVYPADINNMKPIEEILNNDSDPQFIFNVAVESHGPYSDSYKPEVGGYTVSGDITDAERNQLQEYVEKVKNVDKYVGELVEYVKNLNKPTIIAFYSDHLPVLKLIDNANNFDITTKYKSNYFIWSNVGIKPKEQEIMAYQLSTYVLNLAGIEGGVMPLFHKVNGNSESYTEDLKNIQYDQLNGSNYLGAEKIEKSKDMKLGLEDIKITNACIYNGVLEVNGENFTKASKIFIKDKPIATEYNSENKLIAYNVENINEIKVCQIGKNNKILSSTELFKITK